MHNLNLNLVRVQYLVLIDPILLCAKTHFTVAWIEYLVPSP